MLTDMPLVIATAYLIGSIPFALLLARRWGGKDLRRVGSGNVGATNVLRALGVTPGVIAVLLDVAKGMASVWLAERVHGGETAPAAAGLAAVLGHIYPVWLGFRGGKGVATACGVFSMLTPIATLASLGVFFVVVWMTRYVSVGSMLASATLPPVAYAAGSPAPIVATACGLALLILVRHRTNIARVIGGTERTVGFRESQL
jgi:glycerol-3-phosphate acyltransferase PlsY